MDNDYIDYMSTAKRGLYTETHTVSLHLFNDWTEKVQVVRDNVDYDIPEYAAVYARYNKTTNETEIRFTWTTIERVSFDTLANAGYQSGMTGGHNPA